jgi:hypothetical protein
MENLFSEVSIAASVDNSSKDAPRVVVEAEVVVHTYFLRWIPGLHRGISLAVMSESSVVERTKWD